MRTDSFFVEDPLSNPLLTTDTTNNLTAEPERLYAYVSQDRDLASGGTLRDPWTNVKVEYLTEAQLRDVYNNSISNFEESFRSFDDYLSYMDSYTTALEENPSLAWWNAGEHALGQELTFNEFRNLGLDIDEGDMQQAYDDYWRQLAADRGQAFVNAYSNPVFAELSQQYGISPVTTNSDGDQWIFMGSGYNETSEIAGTDWSRLIVSTAISTMLSPAFGGNIGGFLGGATTSVAKSAMNQLLLTGSLDLTELAKAGLTGGAMASFGDLIKDSMNFRSEDLDALGNKLVSDETAFLKASGFTDNEINSFINQGLKVGEAFDIGGEGVTQGFAQAVALADTSDVGKLFGPNGLLAGFGGDEYINTQWMQGIIDKYTQGVNAAFSVIPGGDVIADFLIPDTTWSSLTAQEKINLMEEGIFGPYDERFYDFLSERGDDAANFIGVWESSPNGTGGTFAQAVQDGTLQSFLSNTAAGSGLTLESVLPSLMENPTLLDWAFNFQDAYSSFDDYSATLPDNNSTPPVDDPTTTLPVDDPTTTPPVVDPGTLPNTGSTNDDPVANDPGTLPSTGGSTSSGGVVVDEGTEPLPTGEGTQFIPSFCESGYQDENGNCWSQEAVNANFANNNPTPPPPPEGEDVGDGMFSQAARESELPEWTPLYDYTQVQMGQPAKIRNITPQLTMVRGLFS